MAQKDMPSARERRLRRAAARKGLSLRKVQRGQDRGRYQLVDPEFGGARHSESRAHPYSFSLEEAESYIDTRDQVPGLRDQGSDAPET